MSCDYLKLDMTHPDYQATRDAIEAHFLIGYPRNRLSVNANLAGTAAWVKARCGHGVAGPVVLDTADYATRQKVVDDVTGPEWTPAQ